MPEPDEARHHVLDEALEEPGVVERRQDVAERRVVVALGARGPGPEERDEQRSGVTISTRDQQRAPAHAAAVALRGMPVQHAPLAGGEQRVQRPPEQAGGDDQRVHLVDGAALAGDVDRAPEAFGADDQLGGDREDQRGRRRDPQAGRDVGHRAHQRHAQDAVAAPDAERARGLELQRVEVAGAVDRLDQQRPGRRERDQEDLALQAGAVDEDRQRDQRDGRDRAQELDHRPAARYRTSLKPSARPSGHRDRDRDARARSPSPRACARSRSSTRSRRAGRTSAAPVSVIGGK